MLLMFPEKSLVWHTYTPEQHKLLKKQNKQKTSLLTTEYI